ncbi:MAG: GAF domain-containing protein [Chloroflexi bacterium]|nr:GAF domain-containing protein [Chloroflexota bacterium]
MARPAHVEAITAERRFDLLVAATKLFSSTSDYGATLAGVARLLVPDLADWCTVHVLDAEGHPYRSAVAHRDQAEEAGLREWQGHFTKPSSDHPIIESLHTAQAQLYPDVPDTILVAIAENETHLELLRQAGMTSAIVVPLVARDETLGVIAYGTLRDGHRYTTADLELGKELASRAALALDNARLLREARARTEEIETLYEAAKQVVRSLDLTETLHNILEVMVQLSKSDVVAVALVDPDAQTLRYVAGRGPSARELPGYTFQIGEGLTGLTAATGRAFNVPAYQHEPRALHRSPVIAAGIHSALFVPLLAGSRVIGVLTALSQSQAHYTGRRERLLTGLADYASLAIRHAHDTAERRRIQEELGASEARYRELFDDAPVGYHELDPDGRVVRVNRTELTMLGYTEAEMLGREAWEFHQAPAIARESFLTCSQRAKPGHELERVLRRKDGVPIPVLMESRPLRDAAGRLIGVRVTSQDITERQRAEAERAQLERARDDFIAMISHELRTPLGVIKGYATTLLLPDAPDDARTRHDCLAAIAEACDELQDLVDHLLDISLLRAGAFEVALRAVDLVPILRSTVRRVETQYPSAKLSIRALTGLPHVWADPRRLDQVVANLLDNAVKYAPPSAPVRLTVKAAGPEVTVSVVDRGPGLPPDQIGHLFDKFQRGTNGQILGVRGAGLGLAIAKAIVEAHGGRLWAESPVPRRRPLAPPGAAFRFTLRLADGPRNEATAASQVLESAKNASRPSRE